MMMMMRMMFVLY